MDPLTNEGHLPLTNQADQLRTMNSVRVNPEQMVPKIETGIIDITPHSHLEHQSTLDSPQKIDSPINDDQGKAKNMYIENNNKQIHKWYVNNHNTNKLETKKILWKEKE